MAKTKATQAAGALVFDGAGRVATVHRPRYDDVSLPKGKTEPGEYAAAAAAREVREETGAVIALESELPSVRYRAPQGPKRVRWWRARLLELMPRQPDAEVDAVHWLPPEVALRRLSYSDDRDTLTSGLQTPPGPALVVLRHAKALPREDWPDSDDDRPLDDRGREQAAELVAALQSFGVADLISSPAERCLATLRPYAASAGLRITECTELSEPAGERDPAAAARVVADAAARAAAAGRAVAICGHRPLLPVMLTAARLAPVPLKPGKFRSRGLGA